MAVAVAHILAKGGANTEEFKCDDAGCGKSLLPTQVRIQMPKKKVVGGDWFREKNMVPVPSAMYVDAIGKAHLSRGNCAAGT